LGVGGDGQLDLFDEQPASSRPERVGHTEVTYRTAASILTPATGFMSDYDFTLNPYSGCSMGCTYCYAAFFSRDRQRQDSWGRWVEVKENALEQLRRMRTRLTGKRIYMSSVTDPYQPIERRLGLVRQLLEELIAHQPRLVVQTRSGLLTRDIDLFRAFDHIRVNMTVTTDVEAIRRQFEPWCPTSAKRLAAITEVARAGVPTCVTLTPLLPVHDADEFARSLLATGADRFVVQPFHVTRGRFVAGTRDEAVRLLEGHGWDESAYRDVVTVLRARLPRLDEGRHGFEPV
jgi:DNA repair photolyase